MTGPLSASRTCGIVDNRRCICLSGIGLDICKSRPAETAKHEMDIRIKG